MKIMCPSCNIELEYTVRNPDKIPKRPKTQCSSCGKWIYINYDQLVKSLVKKTDQKEQKKKELVKRETKKEEKPHKNLEELTKDIKLNDQRKTKTIKTSSNGKIPTEIKSHIIYFVQKAETQYQSQGLSKEIQRRKKELFNYIFGGKS